MSRTKFIEGYLNQNDEYTGATPTRYIYFLEEISTAGGQQIPL